MKRSITISVALGLFSALFLATSTGAAQESAGPEPAPVTARTSRSTFQLAGRAGYAVPLGRMSGLAGDEMRETLGGQVPLTIDLGWWLSRHLLVGGMLSYGFGSASGHLQEHCEQSDVGCPTVTTRLGLQMAYHFAPTSGFDPWLGYGFGENLFHAAYNAEVANHPDWFFRRSLGPHNVFLALWFAGGVGLVASVVGSLLAYYACVGRALAGKRSARRPILLAGACSMLAYLVIRGSFESIPFRVCGLAFGLALAYAAQRPAPDVREAAQSAGASVHARP